MKKELLECSNKKDCWVQMFWTVSVWTKWQVVIPSQVRKNLNINTWDQLIVVTKYWKAIWMIKADDLEELMEYMRKEMESK